MVSGVVWLIVLALVGVGVRAWYDNAAAVAPAGIASQSPRSSPATPGASVARGPADPGSANVADSRSAERRTAAQARALRLAEVRTEPAGRAERGLALTQTIIVPTSGPGTYRGAHRSSAPASSLGKLLRFDVRVETNLRIDPDQSALLIAGVLNDKRSWRVTGRWRFRLVKAGQRADLHLYLVTPGTTNRLCAPLLTRGEVSCQNGRRVVLNAKRWVFGVRYYGDDLTGYRRYLINHEVGHALGYDHVRCPGRGKPAPVMMQQTKGLDGCRRNPWPRVA
jgi:hypothetical protein